MARVRMEHAYGEVAPNTWGDIDWVREHRKELLEQYGECDMIVYEKKVIGTGKDYKTAVADAERNLAAQEGEVTPIWYALYRRHPFLRVRIKSHDTN